VLTLQFIARAIVTMKGMGGKGAGFCYPIWGVIRRRLRFLQYYEPARRPISGANEIVQKLVCWFYRHSEFSAFDCLASKTGSFEGLKQPEKRVTRFDKNHVHILMPRAQYRQ
jgi:hypothetical protein